MKRAMVISVLFILLTSVISFAQGEETQIPEVVEIPLADDVPEVYIVKEGDTLWDIAQRFFGEPVSWPDIWKKNFFIEDPHWIYPDQEITLKSLLEKISEPEKVYKPLRQPEPVIVETAPRTVVPEKVIEAAPQIVEDNSNVISFLAEPRPAYRKESYMRTGFIAKRSEIPQEMVIGIEGGTSRATKYDEITIDIGVEDGAKRGDVLAVLTEGDRIKHPDTGKDMGFVVRIKGLIEIIQAGDGQSKCVVNENFDPIAVDDLVMSIRLTEAPEYDAWVKPEETINATLIARNEPMVSIHIDDILYIDKGSNHGVKPGDRFTIYRRGDDKKESGHRTPLGEIQAVNVMAGETAIIVVSLNGEKISIGDRADLTARCRLIH
ncbi:LysM peptidoglycan-binding domain-containing protein [Candidatus Latescibacterota bacterium]